MNQIKENQVGLSFSEKITLIEKLIYEINLNKHTAIPLKLRHKTDLANLDLSKPIAILIGELHSGAKVQGINSYKSNSIITKFLLNLYQHRKELNLGDALKEGTSEIEFDERYSRLSLDDFLKEKFSPAISVKHLLKKDGIEVNFLPAESSALINKFAILSYLYCSFPGECTAIELEQNRILNILNLSSSENIKNCKLLVRELEKELFIHKEPLSNLIKKVKLLPDLDIFTLRQEHLLKNMEKEISDLKVLTKAKLKRLCLERDKFVAMNFMKFTNGMHPILIGELHVNNLIQLLEEQGVPCLYLSAL